jgi:hypothetical protein
LALETAGASRLVGVTVTEEVGRLTCECAIPMAGMAPRASAPAAAHFKIRLIIIGNSFAENRAARHTGKSDR